MTAGLSKGDFRTYRLHEITRWWCSLSRGPQNIKGRCRLRRCNFLCLDGKNPREDVAHGQPRQAGGRWENVTSSISLLRAAPLAIVLRAFSTPASTDAANPDT